MGFGIKYIQGAEQDKIRSTKKSLDEQCATLNNDEMGSAVPVPAPEKEKAKENDVVKSVAPPKTSFRQSSLTNYEQNEDEISEHSRGTEEIDDEGNIVVSEANLAIADKAAMSEHDAKGLRARRLVQEIGEFKKWSSYEIAAKEKEALRNPDAVIAEMKPVYQQEIKPFRDKGCRSLNDALEKHPNEVVFLLTKGSVQRLRVVSVDEAQGQQLLHGAIVESVASNSTRFPPPSQLFVSGPQPRAAEAEAEATQRQIKP